MAAVSRVSYRHLMRLTATGNYRLMASQSMMPNQTYNSRPVQTDGPAPVDTVFQDEDVVYRSTGPADIGDMVLMLANWLPHNYTAGTQLWEFAWQDKPKPATWDDPASYATMLAYSRTDQNYTMATPTLQRWMLDLRRRGQATMSSEWLCQDLQTVTRPSPEPTPNPVPRGQIIAGNQWAVRYSADGANFTAFPGCIRCMVDIPNFLEGVYSMTGSGASFNDTAINQIIPKFSVYTLMDSTWVSQIFPRSQEQYFELDGGGDFTLRCHAKKDTQQIFQLDGAKQLVQADFVMIGYFGGQSAAAASTTISGVTSSTVQASPTPTTTTFTLASASGFAVGDVIDVDGEEATISAITSNAITVSPALSAAPSASDTVTNKQKFTVASVTNFSVGDNITVDGQATEITAIATNLITVSPALTAIPAISNAVLRAAGWDQSRYMEIDISNTIHSSVTN